MIYATGLEPSPAGVPIEAPRAVSGITAQIGNAAATVLYSGLIGPGLFQINAVVPDTPAGNQPFFIASQFVPSPQGVVIPIAFTK